MRLSRVLVTVHLVGVTLVTFACKQKPVRIPNPEWREDLVSHFLCYRIIPVAADSSRIPFTAYDEFHTANGVPAHDTTIVAERLCNPMKKYPGTRDSVTWLHESVHLVCYAIETSSQGDSVVVNNQFEHPARWWVRRPALICLPSSKDATRQTLPDPDPLPHRVVDHFRCYDLLNAPPFAQTVPALDQFGLWTVTTTRAEQICNPTEKEISKKGERPVINATAHLACYGIDPGQTHVPAKPPPAQVFIRNQFWNAPLAHRVKIEDAPSWICLPSAKEIIMKKGSSVQPPG
jgi:hypothetical protein